MSDPFEVMPLPKTRRAIRDMLRVGQRKHMIHGMLEIDVTHARQWSKRQKEITGETLSFTAFIVTCLAKAVDENKIVQGYRKGNSKIVLFDDVDVNTQIEREIEGRKWVMPYIIRGADKKSFSEIHREIRAAQVKQVKESEELLRFEWYLRIPSIFRRLFFWIFVRSPVLEKRIAGTVGVTSLGMFAEGGFWGIPITTQTLLVTLGGIAKKPAIVHGSVEEREILSVTVSVDHDIIDGAPAARFTQRLKELIESGYGLSALDSV
jgi:pyruvate/2-oxoglutarate dehydrogenase complex dihydrolipoamide acyltransferase (E2) component